MTNRLPIAIIGAGPVGLAAASHLLERGETPLAVGVLIVLPPATPWLLLFAGLYGAAKGTMTIVRGTAVAEQMGPSVYARTNGWLAMAGTIARAAAPVGIVALWEAWANPDAVLCATLALFLLAFAGIPVMRLAGAPSESA